MKVYFWRPIYLENLKSGSKMYKKKSRQFVQKSEQLQNVKIRLRQVRGLILKRNMGVSITTMTTICPL
jgi:hypothetical protein